MPACGASVKVDGIWRVCGIAGAELKSLHQHRPHRDSSGYEWPACSQMCAQDHVHGRYRVHMGVATGPVTQAARAPKLGPPARPPKVARCTACLEPAVLDENGKPTGLGADGRRADREACRSRQPELFEAQ